MFFNAASKKFSLIFKITLSGKNKCVALTDFSQSAISSPIRELVFFRYFRYFHYLLCSVSIPDIYLILPPVKVSLALIINFYTKVKSSQYTNLKCFFYGRIKINAQNKVFLNRYKTFISANKSG